MTIAGPLPVGENDRLIGMVTDRDIAVRAVAEGKPASAKVRDVMSEKVFYCFDDNDVAESARLMSEHQVRRLPVLNRDKRLVGIVRPGRPHTPPTAMPRLRPCVGSPKPRTSRADSRREGPRKPPAAGVM
jgi:CBS-domain-containing membrane protein